MMKQIGLVVLMFLVGSSLLAQRTKQYVEQNNNYSLARIYTKNHKIIKVKNLELVNDTIMNYKTASSHQQKQIAVADLKYVSVKTGTKALSYGLWGAGVGAMAVLYAVGDVYGDPNLEFRDNLGLRITLIVGGSAAIGAGIGALIPKWKRLYFNKSNQLTSFILYPTVYKDYYCVSMTINL